MTSLPILTYHALDDSGRVTSTRRSWFRETLASLRSEGFHCVDLQSWIEAGRPATERGFAIAFDDGLASCRFAADVLVGCGFTATLFLVSGRMGLTADWEGGDGSRLLDWGVLENLRAAGFRFAAHTVSHPRLGMCEFGSVEHEILGSRSRIEAETGERCSLFAYPYGEASPVSRGVVAQHFEGGFTTRMGFACQSESSSGISRVDAYYLRTPRALRSFLSGRFGPRLAAIRAARSARRALTLGGLAARPKSG